MRSSVGRQPACISSTPAKAAAQAFAYGSSLDAGNRASSTAAVASHSMVTKAIAASPERATSASSVVVLTQPADLDSAGRLRASMGACRSRTNADDRLPRASLGRVEGGDGVVEGRDVADVRPQSSVPHPLDDRPPGLPDRVRLRPCPGRVFSACLPPFVPERVRGAKSAADSVARGITAGMRGASTSTVEDVRRLAGRPRAFQIL